MIGVIENKVNMSSSHPVMKKINLFHFREYFWIDTCDEYHAIFIQWLEWCEKQNKNPLHIVNEFMDSGEIPANNPKLAEIFQMIHDLTQKHGVLESTHHQAEIKIIHKLELLRKNNTKDFHNYLNNLWIKSEISIKNMQAYFKQFIHTIGGEIVLLQHLRKDSLLKITTLVSASLVEKIMKEEIMPQSKRDYIDSILYVTGYLLDSSLEWDLKNGLVAEFEKLHE